VRYLGPAVFFLILLAVSISIRPVFSYARISNVELYAPYQGGVNEEIPVEAHVYTGNNLVEYVHEVQVVLLLPPNASVVSGDNPLYIGEMGPGPSFARITWTVKFDEPSECTLLVNASCIDTQNMPRWMNATATIQIYGPPHAELEYNPAADVHVNDTVIFNATKSYPRGPDSTIVSYAWDFGDGTDSTTSIPTVEHKFSNVGNYIVTLNVTDDKELSSLNTTTIAISLLGDINFDGTVDILDIYVVAKAFDAKPGDPNWDPMADVNRDGLINILDIFAVAIEYGKTV